MINAIAFLILLAPAPVRVSAIDSTTIAGLGAWRTVQLDLDVSIAPDDSALSVDGRVTLELERAASSTLGLLLNSRRPEMQFDRLAVVDAAGADPALVTRESFLGAGVNDSMTVELLTFPRSLAPGDRVTIEFAYHSAGQSKQVVVQPDVAYASWVEAWYPLPADPSNASDPHSGALARARGTTRFHLPAGWHALSNGRLMHHDETRRRVVDTWQDNFGAARSFVAAPFMKPETVSAGDRTVAVYLLTPKPFGLKAMTKQLSAAIDVLSERFGPYPYGTFAIAEVPGNISGFGAASEQGFIVAKTYFLDVEDGNLALFAHEAGHTWWGNLVSTTGKGHQLVSESLAQFGAVISIEAADGHDAARDFLEFSRPGYVMNQCARGYFTYVRADLDRPMSELDGSTIFDHTLSDAKGHWIYWMLRDKLGDDVFYTTMRAIIERHKVEPLSLDALRREFQEAAPDAGLDRFFHQWLDRTGAPVLDVEWTLEKQMIDSQYVDHPVESIMVGGEAPPFDVTVDVMQTQGGEPYVLDLEIEFDLIDGTRERHVIPLRETRTSASIQFGKLPRSLRLDPDRRILMWRHVYGPRPRPAGDAAERPGASH